MELKRKSVRLRCKMWWAKWNDCSHSFGWVVERRASFKITLQLMFQTTWVDVSSLKLHYNRQIIHVTWSKAGVCLLYFLVLLPHSFIIQNECDYLRKHELENIHSFSDPVLVYAIRFTHLPIYFITFNQFLINAK